MKVIISDEAQFDEYGSNITIVRDPRGPQKIFDVFMLTRALEQSLRRKYYNQFHDLFIKYSFSSNPEYYHRLEELFFFCLHNEMGIILKLQKEECLTKDILFSLSRKSVHEAIHDLFPEIKQPDQHEALIAISENGSSAGAQVMLDFFIELRSNFKTE